MFVLGTAGHIDHGKSALVRALTGMDPDRLQEEKERGMTIDLGFAWLTLPSGREVGIVDVPGHERFIKNMLAGVGGIDVALLIVAANEGVMPQTREHMAILDLLEVTRGIVVITKRDLVDDELLTLVKIEVSELVSTTTLSDAPIVAVSALTGAGLPELLATIDRMLDTTEPRKDMGRPRLPVDRVFSIAGSGTIVTGTLIDGSLSVGQEVEIVPSGLKSRLRSLQTHKVRIDTARPGSRVAANLVGIATSQVARGQVLTTPGWLTPSVLVSGHIRLLPYLRQPLKHNASTSFHTGTAEAMARVRLLEKEEISPGEAGWVQISLDQPVAVVNGDHFIIRSPDDTLGGGRIVESHAQRLRRFRPAVIQNLRAREEGTAGDAIIAVLSTRQPLELSALLSQVSVPDAEATMASLVKEGRAVKVGEAASSLLFTTPGWQWLTQRATDIVREYHRRFPARAGMPRVEATSRLKLGDHAAAVWQRLAQDGSIVEEGGFVRIPSHRIQLSPVQKAKVDAFLKELERNPYSPSGEIPEADLLNLLVEQGAVVKVSESVVFSTAAYNDIVAKVVAHIRAKGKVTLAEVRDMLQTSRKYAQAVLEYMDEKKITRRVADERVLR